MTKRVFKNCIICLLLVLVMIFATACGFPKLSCKGWNSTTEKAINDFLKMYGKSSKNYNENFYAVTDFDNTCSIFDICEQLMIYQMEVMGFAFTPEQLPSILATGLGDMNKDLSYYGYGNGSYNDWIYDICNAYDYLYINYGPFTAEGLDDETSRKVQKDPMWLEFAVKMLKMYELIGANESTDVSYPWITYWYTGMSSEQVYKLAKKSCETYRAVDSTLITIATSKDVKSKVGVVVYQYVDGITVTDNIVELWKLLSENGIDVWVCTASEIDIIRAAIDVFGLHNYCSGVIGMTPKQVNGKLTNEYDYDSGYAWIPGENGSWSRGDKASKAQTQGIGKVTAIENICVEQYGMGPIAGFMDSTGDFNFCTEFKDLKLVICFNRADRSVTDGAGLIAELAVYQEDVLNYNLKKANKNNDTFYVLQGRNENGSRSLKNSRETLVLGSTDAKLFYNENNEDQFKYFKDKNLNTKDILETFAIINNTYNEDNLLGFDYGFVSIYNGYHSR